MSAAMSEEIRTNPPRMWSRSSASRVVEAAMIGDGPHVLLPRQNNPSQPISTAADQRPRTSTSRRMKFQRKMAFCNKIRSFGGPAFRFGSLSHSDFGMRRDLRGDFHWPMIESWLEFPPYNNEVDEDSEALHESRLFTDRRHWGRAQLYFQQYLGIRHSHHHNPKSNSLKVDLGPGHIKSIYDVLYGMGLKETLWLAFNELLHLH
ncbi:uncharacterized protein LOC117144165 [Drosophila mauritiana]|uniref:Uncharacterized protein LOC117144165 n=1 Tax=Drosophila mauritiana TaxID=7226 RepID=A0A6P8KNY1_DROMA|nr:uncharacterized protein LOC117144165 [Drosophila mauritiana]